MKSNQGHAQRLCDSSSEFDAPVDPMDKTKTTPLHLACREGHADVVKILLKRGAFVGALDANQKNCLDLAVENDHKYVRGGIMPLGQK